jgi:hypothetical protein
MKKISVLVGVLMLSISSCIYTFHPLHSKETLRDLTPLEGSFLMHESGDDSPENWTFTRTGTGTYELEIVKDLKQGTMEAYVVELGGEYFMDVLPEQINTDLIPEFIQINLMPVYTIAKVIVDGENIRLHFFDIEWLEEKLSTHKIRIAHEARRSEAHADPEFILLTAGTEELQKFVSKYANHEDAFESDGTLLTRVTTY